MFKRIFSTLVISGFLTSAAAGAVQAEKFPVTRVILSTSGMAHFEHSSEIKKDTKLELPVQFGQVDDILKSLVVFDAVGQLGGITLPGRSPLDHIFRDLPFTQSDLNSIVSLLNAYQGAHITAQSGNSAISGMLIHVVPEEIVHSESDTVTTQHRVSLLTEDGLKQYILEELSAINFADKELRDQVGKALEAVREHSTFDKRVLALNLLGQGKRDVTVAYVVKAPLWKAAYRLVLPKDDGEEGFLQGWAVIENMTDNDWNAVDLSLVSGNPVTYRQQLYQSYYVQRPELPVEVLGRVLPRTDTGALSSADEAEETFGEGGAYRELNQNAVRGRAMKKSMAPAAAPMMAGMAAMDMAAPMESAQRFEAKNIATAANASQSSEATTQVLFRFPQKFDLDAGETMMLPFINRKVSMERVALYQPDTHATHPFAAVRVKNDGKTGFPPGILTLYEESSSLNGTSFVGDARLPILSKGENRLISYALDSKTQIDRQRKQLTKNGLITIAKGVMRTQTTYSDMTEYVIKAPATESRTVLIEHPRRHDYKIVSPDPQNVEVTKTHYRIKHPVKAGETAKIKVVLERDGEQVTHIRHMSERDIKSYAAQRGKLDKKTRKAFEKLVEIRTDLDSLEKKLQELNRKKQQIFQDQNRIRQNIRSLSGNSSLKKRYMDNLEEQENHLFDLTENIDKLTTDRLQKKEAMERFILTIQL